MRGEGRDTGDEKTGEAGGVRAALDLRRRREAVIREAKAYVVAAGYSPEVRAYLATCVHLAAPGSS